MLDRAIAIIGVILGALGIASGYFFYQAAQQAPALSFAVNPVRTSIVNSSDVSNLSVLYKGNEIHGSNVMSIRVYVWNAGGRPISRLQHDILRPIRLILPTESKILDQKLLHVSRHETQFSVYTKPMTKNSLNIDFDILEKDDGATIQLIYSGDPNADIKLEGSIIGQKNISAKKLYLDTEDIPWKEQIFSLRSVVQLILLLIGFILIIYSFFISLTSRDTSFGFKFPGKMGSLINEYGMIALGLSIVIISNIYALIALTEKYSPVEQVPKNVVDLDRPG
jgi:hypothetical protein